MTKRYFRLREDMSSPERWVLHDTLDAQGQPLLEVLASEVEAGARTPEATSERNDFAWLNSPRAALGAAPAVAPARPGPPA